MDKNSKIVITGAAGLLGQNLITELLSQGYTNLTAIDKDEHNLEIMAKLHPDVKRICADLSERGDWEKSFEGCGTLFLLQAQITGAEYPIFQKNTVDSTKNVIAAAQLCKIPFTVFIGSSVVNSVAHDNYTNSKKEQERLMQESGLPHCVCRPTLMFGWFDPKHFGWLSRFMEKVPVFPIPGNGKFLRQPLFCLDFCRVLIKCAEGRMDGKIVDIVGEQDIDYIDIIRTIKRIKKLHTIILKIPVWLFRFLLKTYSLFSSHPPFVADQLDALMAGDYFKGLSMEKEFGVKPTPFEEAMELTFNHPVYSKVVLERP